MNNLLFPPTTETLTSKVFSYLGEGANATSPEPFDALLEVFNIRFTKHTRRLSNFFICPGSQRPFNQSCILPCGCTFDRGWLERQIRSAQRSSAEIKCGKHKVAIDPTRIRMNVPISSLSAVIHRDAIPIFLRFDVDSLPKWASKQAPPTLFNRCFAIRILKAGRDASFRDEMELSKKILTSSSRGHSRTQTDRFYILSCGHNVDLGAKKSTFNQCPYDSQPIDKDIYPNTLLYRILTYIRKHRIMLSHGLGPTDCMEPVDDYGVYLTLRKSTLINEIRMIAALALGPEFRQGDSLGRIKIHYQNPAAPPCIAGPPELNSFNTLACHNIQNDPFPVLTVRIK